MFPFYSKHKGSLLSLDGLAVKMKTDDYLQFFAAIPVLYAEVHVITLYLMILLVLKLKTLPHFVALQFCC